MISFTIDSLSYAGLGFNVSTNTIHKNLYNYNATTDSWSAKQSFPGLGGRNTTSTSLYGEGYFFCGGGGTGSSFLSNQVW